MAKCAVTDARRRRLIQNVCPCVCTFWTQEINVHARQDNPAQNGRLENAKLLYLEGEIYMKNQIIKIKHKHGRDVVVGNGNSFSFRLASGEIVTGDMQPTFGYQLRRFIRRLIRTANAQIDMRVTVATIPQLPAAADIPVIGLED